MSNFRIVPDNPSFDIIKKRKIAAVFSTLLVIASIGLFFTKGLNYGIDFAGGSEIEIAMPEGEDISSLRVITSNHPQIDGDIQLQEVSAPGGSLNDPHILIRITQQDMRLLEDGTTETQQMANDRSLAAMHEILGENVTFLRTEFVGPAVGEELKSAAMTAVLLSLLGIMIYIWFRFEWQFGLAAIIALAHDAIATIGLFSLTQLEFSLASVAAVLMIAGYSINDTMVVFDRVREELRRYKKKPISEILNTAINNTLSRTILTSLTTLLALAALFIFGGDVLRIFSIALIWGIVIGTYSSIFIAVPSLLFMKITRSSVVNEDDNDTNANVKAGYTEGFPTS